MTGSIGLLILVLALLLFRQNIIIILAVCVSYMHLTWGDGDLVYLIEDSWVAVDKEALLSIPMFILCGAVMTKGSIAQRLIDFMVAFTKPLKGGMGVASILSCAAFAAISGSSPVTLLAVGSVLYPALIQQKYSRSYALGSLTAGGTLGIIIPPSIPMIIYGIATETSIVDLFLAGIIPGILLTGVMVAYSLWINRGVGVRESPDIRFSEAIRRGLPSLMMPVLLLGGIYSGFFTPTESAVIALFYAVIVEAFVHRELSWKDLYNITQETIIMLGSLIPIIAIATSVNLFLAVEGVPAMMAEWLRDNVDNAFLFLIGLNIMLLIVGMAMDTFSALLILGPVLFNIASAYGIHPVHLGIIMILNLEIGLLTPPMGINLMVAMAAFKEPFQRIVTSVLPFIFLMLAVLLVITLFPSLTLFLLE